MKLLIVSDAYPPLHTSCATLIYDLGHALSEIGVNVVIIVPHGSQDKSISIEKKPGLELIRVKAFQTKNVNYVFRLIAEFINPYLMWYRLNSYPELFKEKVDGVVWYSPSIFFGPLIKRLKNSFSCKSYLILRDIFPDWALDLGILKKGIIFNLLKSVERYQYAQADLIGAQSPNNLKYLKIHNPNLSTPIEVLWNWVRPIAKSKCTIELSKTKLANKKILVYAGNMGVAQGMDSFVEMAIRLKSEKDIGFLFIGRGSEVGRLKKLFEKNKIEDILFLDEIDSSEIPDLLSQCSVGLVGLDPRHSTHNIPGKFFSYLQSGLPVIVIANQGNDLKDLIIKHNLGVFGELINDDFIERVTHLINGLNDEAKLIYQKNFLDLTNGLFSPKSAAIQISDAFKV